MSGEPREDTGPTKNDVAVGYPRRGGSEDRALVAYLLESQAPLAGEGEHVTAKAPAVVGQLVATTKPL